MRKKRRLNNALRLAEMRFFLFVYFCRLNINVRARGNRRVKITNIKATVNFNATDVFCLQFNVNKGRQIPEKKAYFCVGELPIKPYLFV